MARLELTLTPEYARWGTWEALRDLVQNWADARDIDHKKQEHRITFGGDNKGSYALKLRNGGVSLSRRTLLLGGTSKANDSGQRGQFGEGMKLAWAALLKKGRSVRVVNNDEVWSISLEHSENFDNELVVVHTSKRQTGPAGYVEVQVGGMAKEDWEAIQERLLVLQDPETLPRPDWMGRRILKDDKYKGQLFARGIHVCALPEQAVWGYDLPVELDRDRRMADPYSLRQQIRDCLAHAAENGDLTREEILTVIDRNPSSIEARSLEEGWSGSRAVVNVVDAFKEVYGEDAVPVSSIAEENMAAQHGLRAVPVSSTVKKIVEGRLGSLESRCNSKGSDVLERFSRAQLTYEQMSTLHSVAEAFSGVDIDILQRVSFVTFRSAECRGLHMNDGSNSILLDRRLLGDRAEFIGVLIHELAHDYGHDGDAQHRAAIEQIAGRVIDALLVME